MTSPSLLRPPKGFRDFLPPDTAKRQAVIGKLVQVFERFGFERLETPTLEYAALLEGKYGDEERLIFTFEDRGGRRVALPYDLTVPLARVVTQHKGKLSLPFKRYQIQKSYRAEKPQAGRFREFTQCDIDIVGSHSPLADAEIISVVNEALDGLGFRKYFILLNDRRVLSAIIKAAGIKKDLEVAAIRILDKLEKIGEAETEAALSELDIPPTKIESLMRLLGKRPLLPGGKPKDEISLAPIEILTRHLSSLGVPAKRLLFTPALARGLDYYTGMVIETTIDGYEPGSVGGGGRYDNLIGSFAKQAIPAVGFSFGLERLIEAMEILGVFPDQGPKTTILVTIMGERLITHSASLANALRRAGINTQLYLTPVDKLDKQLRYADRLGIPWCAILGPDEVAAGTVTLKHLKTGVQETIPREEVAQKLAKEAPGS